VLYELFGRLSRNAFIVLALILPIVAGMGINFAVTIGAMAAQIAALWVIEWGISGLSGFLVAMAMTVPLAAFFGFLIGKLLNKMKGQEMIGGLILGYFANGLYQLLFLFIFGNLIPLNAPGLVIKGSTGVANTIDLSTERGFKYALDGLWRVDFGTGLFILCAVMAVMIIVNFLRKKQDLKKTGIQLGGCAALCLAYLIPAVKNLFSMVQIPMITFLLVGMLCVFNNALMRTRLGQQFRAVGQNRTVANVSGINVDRVRVIAIVISTVLAGWGQLIFVQNMGSFQTYGAHEQVGLYAGAAILVGGASIKKATNAQAMVGCVLFHLLFIVAPSAGKNLFGDAAIGEYFRVFISYGVIALALVMHAWSGVAKKKKSAK
jgi:simple sugar transport system permease protein